MAMFVLAATGGDSSQNTLVSAIGDGLREIIGGPSIAVCCGPADTDASVVAASTSVVSL